MLWMSLGGLLVVSKTICIMGTGFASRTRLEESIVYDDVTFSHAQNGTRMFKNCVMGEDDRDLQRVVARYRRDKCLAGTLQHWRLDSQVGKIKEATIQCEGENEQ